MLSIALPVAMLATSAMALPEPKVTITYSLETADGGGYFQKISGTLLGAGDVDFVFDVVDSGDPKVTVFVASPLFVTMEFTAHPETGDIVDGPVELVDAYFDREWEIVDGFGLTTVNNDILVWLSRKATGTLSIPDDPILVGVPLSIQAVTYGPLGPARFTNLWVDTISLP